MREAPLSLLLPTLMLAAANIYFGLDTRLTVELTGNAAVLLMRGHM